MQLTRANLRPFARAHGWETCAGRGYIRDLIADHSYPCEYCDARFTDEAELSRDGYNNRICDECDGETVDAVREHGAWYAVGGRVVG